MSDAPADAAATELDPMAVIEAWRAGATGRVDPVALAVIEGLARRAAAQQGPARRWMMDRIETLLTQHAARTAQASRTSDAPDSHRRGPSLAGLSDLVDQLGRSPASTPTAPAPSPALQPSRTTSTRATDRSKKASPAAAIQAASPQPLRSVTAFKSTWSRLRAEQRLREVLAQVPAMAGPLNSAHVVNRALQAMRDLSPQYLDAFILQVDALLWLEQASGGDLMPRTAASSDDRHRPAERKPRKS